jgi:hypothetical protein
VFKARNTVAAGLNDWNNAWAYLAKKKKDEFGSGPETVINNNLGITNENSELTDEQLIDRARAKGIVIPASIMRRFGKKGKQKKS